MSAMACRADGTAKERPGRSGLEPGWSTCCEPSRPRQPVSPERRCPPHLQKTPSVAIALGPPAAPPSWPTCAVSFMYERWAVAQIVPCIHRGNCPSSWAVAQGPFSAAKTYTEPWFWVVAQYVWWCQLRYG